ncbi:MAG: YfhO family protein [Lachnospiraceae bacterium]|nr:YfhO family protein [Lachnospiraceae bacterium]
MKSFFSNKRKKYWYGCAIVLYLLVILAVLALMRMAPFGAATILTSDLREQYFVFLAEYQEKLQSAGFSLFDWSMGSGSDFLLQFAYYLSSPWNLLLLLCSREALVYVITVLIFGRMILGGLMFLWYADHVGWRRDWMVILLSCCYVFCGWTCAYYFNIIWLDAFWLLPLLAAGIQDMAEEGRWKRYVFVLTLAIWCNYYMGYMLCLFSVLWFFFWCTLRKLSRKDVLRRTVGMAIGGLAAVGCCTMLLLPSLLTQGDRIAEGLEIDSVFLNSLPTVLAQLLSFHTFAVLESDVPNLETGLLPLVLLVCLFASRKVQLREKLLWAGCLFFFILSTNLTVLNRIWHAFTVPSSFPSRFTFLYSFVLLAAVGWFWQQMERPEAWTWLLHGAVTLLLTVCGYFAGYGIVTLAENLIFSLLIGIALFVYFNEEALRLRRLSVFLLTFLVLIEAGWNLYTAMKSMGILVELDEILSIMDKREEVAEELDDGTFYRLETEDHFTINDPALLNKSGVSVFSSAVNTKMFTALNALGLDAAVNRVKYTESSPVADMFLSLRYILTVEDESRVLRRVTEVADDFLVTENELWLPLGFQVSADFASLDIVTNLFDMQNYIVQYAAGDESLEAWQIAEEGDWAIEGLDDYGFDENDILLYQVDTDSLPEGDTLIVETDQDIYVWQPEGLPYIEKTFTTTASGDLYLYVNEPDDNIYHVSCAGVTKLFYSEDCAAIVYVGNFDEGETVTVRFYLPSDSEDESLSGSIFVNAATLSEDNLRAAYDILSQGVMEDITVDGSYVSGTVQVEEGGSLLYTSIPYSEGWTAYVDGEEQEITPLLFGGFCGLELEEGEHTIEFRYFTPGLKVGAAVSVISVFLTGLSCIYDRGRKGKRRLTRTGEEEQQCYEEADIDFSGDSLRRGAGDL